MARPENYDDIELTPIEIARIEVGNMGTDPELLTGYAAFLKAIAKAGATATASYNTVTVTREPGVKEKDEQLRSKQSSYDESKKQYEIYASVGKCEYSYMESSAKRYAEAEGLPWPPETEPIALSDTLDKIDAVVTE